MAVRMLIDASHAEETRVAIVKGNRVEDFDFESASKKQLKGNIYLAKVTRVEPSLQAAFVDYGGNRHGFLAFSEIHPDYYQIPVEDREALLAEERQAEEEAAAEEEEAAAENAPRNGNGDETAVESIVSQHDDVTEELPRRPKRLKRHYKIQEVIRRRQVLLVQVVKEERGNKGAALTTYLSLAGRYCVFMPNTHHGGGISRKIANPKDRRKLKSLLSELNLPDGMGCIIRTAGLSRTKLEIKRDFDYLKRTWDEIRENTLTSIAPALIYEEGNLIKRAIRDIYSRDMDEILVEGEEGYKIAKNFIKLLMPSHAKKVQHYKEAIPLFHRYQVEGQLDSMYSPVVHLKSGGYIVINPTEALVSIDVNSGRATREHNIEETALRTNLEAAEEVARQLRLRDMAGLIVIDFIDMEDRRNNREVERRLKECLKHDRARIQVGRISGFGLMEMSRQRLRPGLLEASTRPCPHCEGTGIVRSVESSALHALRAIEEEGMRGRANLLRVFVPTAVALYLLNQKRRALGEVEARYNIRISIEVDDTLIAPKYRIERETMPEETPVSDDAGKAVEDTAEDVSEERADEEVRGEENGGGRRRRRRRRGGRDRDRDRDSQAAASPADAEDAESDEAEDDADREVAAERPEAAEGQAEPRKRRRRGRRGGRRRGRDRAEEGVFAAQDGEPSADAEAEGEADLETAEADAVFPETAETEALPEPVQHDTPESLPKIAAPKAEAEAGDGKPEEDAKAEAKAPRRRRPSRAKESATEEAVVADSATEPAAEPAAAEPDQSVEPAEPVMAAPEPAPASEPAPEPVLTPAALEHRHISSAPVKVVEVSSEATAEKAKKGWWRR